MNNNNTISKASIVSNFLWRFLERCGYQAINIVVQIILARILTPSVYGIIALVTVFTAIMQVFIDSGLGSALIQKKDASDIDFSTVFYFNIAMSVTLYAVMFLIAPYIAKFYQIAELTPVIRVLSLNLIIAGIKNIQLSYVSKHLIFKKYFYSSLAGIIIAASAGVWMAYNGYGVWALVAQQLINMAINTVVLWFTVNWKPKLLFSLERLKKLISYGWKLLASTLLNTLYSRLQSLLIGKLYTKEELAFYDRGELFPSTIVYNINSSIDSVLFPTMSSFQDDREKVKAMTRRAISVSTYIIIPCMVGLAACAEPIVKLVLTDKWLNSAFFLRIFCFSYAFYPIHTANLNAINAMGRSDLFLKLEIQKKVVGLITLLSTVFISVKAMAYSIFFTSIAGQIINAWPNKKLLNYSYLDQIKDIFPSLTIASLMGIIVYSLNFLALELNALLTIQIISGITIYIALSYLFRIEAFFYLINSAKAFYKKQKNKNTN